MPLIAPETKAELLPLRIKLEASELDRLKQYAEHLNSSVDHIVRSAVNYVIGKDKTFTQKVVPVPAAEPQKERQTRRPTATAAD